MGNKGNRPGHMGGGFARTQDTQAVTLAPITIRIRAFDRVGGFKFWFDVKVKDDHDAQELKRAAVRELKRIRDRRRVRTLGIKTLRYPGGEIKL